MRNFKGERMDLAVANKISLSHHLQRYLFCLDFLPVGVVLDAACGSGYGSYLIARNKDCSVTGIDISKEAIDYAQTNFQLPRLSFDNQNVMSTGYSDDHFDAIVSFETLEHLEYPEEAVLEFLRVLKPGGVFIASVPDFDTNIGAGHLNPFHFNEMKLNQFKEMLSSKFANVGIFYQESEHVKESQGFVRFLKKNIPYSLKFFLKKISTKFVNVDPDYLNGVSKGTIDVVRSVDVMNYSPDKRYFWLAVCRK